LEIKLGKEALTRL